MDDRNAHEALQRIMLATDALARQQEALERLTRQAAEAQHVLDEAQAALRASVAREEVRLREAMLSLFAEQQQLARAALRPATRLAWLGMAALGGAFVLLSVVGVWRLTHEHERLRLAEARADAAEIGADVQEAMRHVEITSCGGRPCIRIEAETPRWKGNGGEYVLIDAKPQAGGPRKR